MVVGRRIMAKWHTQMSDEDKSLKTGFERMNENVLLLLLLYFQRYKRPVSTKQPPSFADGPELSGHCAPSTQ